MKFLRLLKSDMRNGIARLWYRYAAALGVFTLSAVFLWSASAAQGAGPLSFGDYLVAAFFGMKEYFFELRDPFNFPALWMLVFLVIAYLTLNYPYEDLMGSGKHELVESGNRSLWWFSKCCWVVASVLLFYAAAAFGVFLVALAAGGSLDLSLSPSLPALLDFGSAILPAPWNIAGLLLLFPAMTMALCLLQLLLSLAMKPMPSFFCSIAILFFSAYFKEPFLPGNYLMAARSEVFIASGMSAVEGAGIALGMAIVSVLCGWALFLNKDIMEKE